MSTKDLMQGYESIAKNIQGFMWKGKPLKSEKIEHMKEELEKMLESIRKECWSYYDSNARELGWKE
ncbi:hypothetical protein [Bacillus rhizoplanae]|uniref:hypothetical protein n=1 Tax=Bacillus rhizoplanae TaxID=2880966 RepID=UPI003D219DD8